MLYTEVYINKLGIKEPDILLSIENDLTYQRLSELHINPVIGRFGRTHLLKIHKYIFQDLYLELSCRKWIPKATLLQRAGFQL